ncbi:uncharacterized protein LOC143301365 [Babylonia areolata]|uniref:uncharacterized protein LOC143301365 n=1 Tax=Babylonia areolata TaxID=304850 RepID=UPI003FD6B316
MTHSLPPQAADHVTPSPHLTVSTPASSSSCSLPSTGGGASLMSGRSQHPILSTPSVGSGARASSNPLGVDSGSASTVVTSSLSTVHSSSVVASLASGGGYNTSVITTLASDSVCRNSVTTTQAYVASALEKTLAYKADSTVMSGSGPVSSGSSVAISSSSGSGAISSTGSGLSLGSSAMSSAGSVAPSKSHKGKKSGGKKAGGSKSSSSASSADVSTAAATANASSAPLDSDPTGGNTSHKLLQAVRSFSMPFPLPVPVYSQAVQAARASGNVLAERATIVRETVKFFLIHKYWWTTEDYDRIAELVVDQFPELLDPSTNPPYSKVRTDLSMCARNIRRITKNQEKRRGSPANTLKDGSASSQGETATPPPPPPPPPSQPSQALAPKASKGGGGKGRRKSSAAPSISVPTMVTLASAAQMLPHTAHTAALHTPTLSSQDPKELANLPYLLSSTSPISTTTTTATTTTSCTVLPPVAHFLGHASSSHTHHHHHHPTGGIVFPSLLPATHAAHHATSATSQPSPPPPMSSPPPVASAVGGTAGVVEEGRAEGVGVQEGYADSSTLSLSGAWRADAQLPDPLPVPPYSEKRRVRTDLSQTARNIRRREVMLRRRGDSRSPEARFTAVGTVSVPPPPPPTHGGAQQITTDFCNELLAAASIIESRTAALHQGDVNKAAENHHHHHAQQAARDTSDAIIASVIAHTHTARAMEGPGASAENGKETVDGAGKETEVGKYPYSFVGGEVGGGGGGAVNSQQLAVIKQEAGEVVGGGGDGGEADHLQQQAWLSSMSQALSMQQALSSLSTLPPHVSHALSDHLLTTSSSSHTSATTTTLAPPAHQSTGGAAVAAGSNSGSSSSSSSSAQHLSQSSGYVLSTPTPSACTITTSTATTPPVSSLSLAEAGLGVSVGVGALSEASPVDRMSAMAMWRSLGLPDPLPVPPYSINVLRARDSGNTASARPRIIRETTQFFLAHKMWWTAPDYERISELVLREFPGLKSVHNIKKDLGTCARNMRRRLPMSKSKQWASYQSPSQAALKEGGEDAGGEGGGVTLGELATMASLREAQDKGRVGGGEVVGGGVVVSVAEDPRHPFLASSVYEQNAWNLFYQQQFPAPDPPTTTTTPAQPSARSTKRSLSEAGGVKSYELGEKELQEALKQAVAQSVRQLGDESAARRHTIDVAEAAKVRGGDLKQESSGKAASKATSSLDSSKSDSYPVMKELMSHPAVSVRDPKLNPDPAAYHATWPGVVVGGEGGGGGAGYQQQHPTPARAHSQPPACPLRSDVSLMETSEEAPMNLTCAPPVSSAGDGETTTKKAKLAKVKTEGKAGKKGGGGGGGGGGADSFSAREQVWFPHGSPWKKSGQSMFKALPNPLPVPKYSHKLVKAREEGLAYRHRSEIIRETARFFLAFKYWWSSADYSRISELVVAQFPDLKDPVTPPGQPNYRRVQRDLSMCARNLRRKNTRQHQLSSGEVVTTPGPKKAKGGGGSKEKKGKKGATIKVETPSDPPSAAQLGVMEGAGGVGSMVGAMLTNPLPPLSTPTPSSSSSSLVQAMLQASVDQALASLPPLTALPPLTTLTSIPSIATTTTPTPTTTHTSSWHVPQHSVLSHLVSPVSTAPVSLAVTTCGATHATTSYPAYTTAHPPAYSTTAAQQSAHSAAHSVSVVVTVPGGAPGKDGGAGGVGVDRTQPWPVLVPAANGLSDTATPTMTATTSATAKPTKKKSAAPKTQSQAAGWKQEQATHRSGGGHHGGATTPKSTASIQPKVVKPLAPSTPTPSGSASRQQAQAESSGPGEGKGRGKVHSEGGVGRKSKDGGRHGRGLSNTTAIVTPTLSEVHSSSGATSSEGSVADKVYINPEHGSELQRQLSQLWQEGKFFDASLEVDNIRLPAHKLVLLAASPYLQSTFRQANPTSHLEVNLPRHTSVEAARNFLKYVYQGVLHVTPASVQALRRIAAMLQIQQLLAYCDDFLLQLSSASSSSSSNVAGVASSGGMAVPHRSSVGHHGSSSQVRRVSVNLREPSHAHPLTTEHDPATLASQTLHDSVPQTLAAPPVQYGSGMEHYAPAAPSNPRKRRATSLASAVEREDREGQKLYNEGARQQAMEALHSQQEAAPPRAKRLSQDSLCVESTAPSSSSSASSKAYVDSQVAVTYHQSLSNSWHRPLEDAEGRQHSVLTQHQSSADKVHGGRGHPSSVIHRGPNLLAAASSSSLPLSQGELIASTSPITTAIITSAAAVGSNNNSSSTVTTFSNSVVEEREGVVQYLADPSDPSQQQVVGGEEESVLVRLLPEGQVQMEIAGVGEGMHLQHHNPHHPHHHTMHITAHQTIQLAAGSQAIHLSAGDDGAIHLATAGGEGGTIHLTEEEAAQLSGHVLASEHGIHLSEQALAEQVCAAQQQQQQLSAGDVDVQLAAEQSIALYGANGGQQRTAEEEVMGMEKGGEAAVVVDENGQVVVRGGLVERTSSAELPTLDSWGGEGEEVVLQGSGVGEEEVMVEEVIVQSGDLLQDVDVAACETVECSLLPQTYCSSPEGGEEEEVVEDRGGEVMVEEARAVVVDGGGGEEEAALQSLASQWVRQQYAQGTPLDADTARQFVAVLQERMYGQQASSSTATTAPLQPPPPAYQETVYVQPCGDDETVYVSQTMEGGELVVETSVVTDPPPQPGDVDDDGDAHTSLLPQTYCSSPPPPPRAQSPPVNS